MSEKLNAKIFEEASAAGVAAASACVPPVMVVSERANPLNDSSPVERQWMVEGGPCGFAWIKVPGNSSFGKWLKKEGKGRSNSYEGGVHWWIFGYGQSMMKKEAFAYAAAAVLRNNGIKAYASSRMD